MEQILTIYLTFKCKQTSKILNVRYDQNSYKHCVWEKGVFLGRVKLKELLFNGYVCTMRYIISENC